MSDSKRPRVSVPNDKSGALPQDTSQGALVFLTVLLFPELHTLCNEEVVLPLPRSAPGVHLCTLPAVTSQYPVFTVVARTPSDPC